MNSKLIKEFQEELKKKGVKLTRTECELISNCYESTITNSIVKGETVTINGIGVFSSSLQTFKTRLNGKQKIEEQEVERFRIKFKTSAVLKKLINEKIKSQEP